MEKKHILKLLVIWVFLIQWYIRESPEWKKLAYWKVQGGAQRIVTDVDDVVGDIEANQMPDGRTVTMGNMSVKIQ